MYACIESDFRGPFRVQALAWTCDWIHQIEEFVSLKFAVKSCEEHFPYEAINPYKP